MPWLTGSRGKLARTWEWLKGVNGVILYHIGLRSGNIVVMENQMETTTF